MTGADLDARNAAFWDELCGSGLARALGIRERTRESLARYDAAYLALYPYLSAYVDAEALSGKRVLEIGLGYGTLGALLATRECEYHGLDIAQAAVELMRYRLALGGHTDGGRVRLGSALAIPHEAGSLDYVYSIGCLHHTGDLARAVSEVHRVLTRGGKAIVMLYNRRSLRLLTGRLVLRLQRLVRGRHSRVPLAEQVRAMYDVNSAGEAAPHTDYVSRRQARALFRAFRHVRIDVRNFDSCVLGAGRLVIRREWFLDNVARVAGLDLYIVATK